jgi:hypothetical protein
METEIEITDDMVRAAAKVLEREHLWFPNLIGTFADGIAREMLVAALKASTNGK